MSETSDLTHRKGLTYIKDEFEDLPPLKPESVIMELVAAQSCFDIGAFCYQIACRERLRAGCADRQIDESSIDIKRREAISNLINWLQAQGPLKAHKVTLGRIKAFQWWIDDNLSSSIDFTDRESVKKAYRDYTASLIRRRNLPKSQNNKGIALTNNSASQLQKTARVWCHCITSAPLSEIEFWAPRILLNDNHCAIPTANPVTLDDCNNTMTGLCQIIEVTWSALIRDKKMRFQIGTQWVDLQERHDAHEVFLKKVIGVSAMSFLAVTGTNRAVALQLCLGDGKYVSTTKGMKYTGIKDRAGGKEVLAEFGSRYLKVWKKYLEIRDHYLAGEHCDHIFPYRNVKGELKPYPARNLDKDQAKRVSGWFVEMTGKKWIAARQWRSRRELRINQHNKGDIVQTAELQSRSVPTTLKSYQHKDLSIVAEEISKALNSIYKAAIERTRSQESIAVKIVDSFQESRLLPTGQCESEESLDPKLATGFTDENPVIPDCRNKETCIFCEHFAVHADRSDIWKLLSLRFLCEELKQSMGHDEYVTQWGPVIYRIDEILGAILNENPSLQPDYDEIQEEVNMGFLDDFWAKRLDTLMNVGVIIS